MEIIEGSRSTSAVRADVRRRRACRRRKNTGNTRLRHLPSPKSRHSSKLRGIDLRIHATGGVRERVPLSCLFREGKIKMIGVRGYLKVRSSRLNRKELLRKSKLTKASTTSKGLILWKCAQTFTLIFLSTLGLDSLGRLRSSDGQNVPARRPFSTILRRSANEAEESRRRYVDRSRRRSRRYCYRRREAPHLSHGARCSRLLAVRLTNVMP